MIFGPLSMSRAKTDGERLAEVFKRSAELYQVRRTMLDEPMTVETLPAPPIPQSKSGVVVASWAGMLFMALGLFGVVVAPETQKAWTDLIAQAAPLVGGLVAFGVTWWRRRNATAPIKDGPADPRILAQKKASEEARAILRSS